MVLFEYHDCLHNNSLPDVDIIFCRDVVSFLGSEAQAAVLAEFEEKLKGNGILILGQNEILSSQSNWSVKSVGSVNVYSKK